MYRFLIVILLVLGLVGCSSSKKPEDLQQDIVSSDIPSEIPEQTAKNGETLTYPAPEGLGENFTCFMGGENGTPVPCSLNDQGEIVVTVPEGVVGGDLDICVMGADGPCQSIGKITIEPNPDPTPSPSPSPSPDLTPLLCQQTGCPEGFECGEDGICQKVEEQPSPPDVCSESKPCPEDQICQDNQCLTKVDPTPAPIPTPECSLDKECNDPMKKCSDEKCIPIPFVLATPVIVYPGTTPPLEATLSVEKDFETKIGLVTIEWMIEGGDDLSEAYLYSNGFNRLPGDDEQENPCGKIGSRYLLVNDQGNNLQPGSSAYVEKVHFLEGKICTTKECQGYISPVKRDAAPFCRIDLIKDGDFVKADSFDTRVRVTNAKFVLFIRTKSGKTKLVESSEVETNKPSLSMTALDIDSQQPQFIFRATYNNAVMEPAIKGCTVEESGNIYNPDGSGEMNLTCPIKSGGENDYQIKVVGIGGASDIKQLKVTAGGEIKADLKQLGFTADDNTTCSATGDNWWKTCDKMGQLKLSGTATRMVKVWYKDEAFNVLNKAKKEVSWDLLKQISVYGPNDTQCDTTLQGNAEILEGSVPRNHQCDHYKLYVIDLLESGKKIDKIVTLWAPYETKAEWVDGATQIYKKGKGIEHTSTLKIQHVKGIQYHCVVGDKGSNMVIGTPFVTWKYGSELISWKSYSVDLIPSSITPL